MVSFTFILFFLTRLICWIDERNDFRFLFLIGIWRQSIIPVSNVHSGNNCLIVVDGSIILVYIIQIYIGTIYIIWKYHISVAICCFHVACI